ncbi:Spy/CpxP family protein refolding chaperone [Pseudoalteromonas sp. GB56]
MKLNKLLTAAVITIGLASTTAIAGKGEHFKHEREMFGERMSQYLALTTEQQDQIKAIKDAQKQERPERGDRAEQKAQFDALTQTSESFDEDAARAMITAKQADHLERQIAHMKAKHQIWNILSTEQQQKLVEMKEKRKERHAQKRAEKRGER